MLLLYHCSRSGNLAADSANTVVNQGLMAFHLYQHPSNCDEGSRSVTCVTSVWVVWQKKKQCMHKQKPYKGHPSGHKRKSLFWQHPTSKIMAIWPAEFCSFQRPSSLVNHSHPSGFGKRKGARFLVQSHLMDQQSILPSEGPNPVKPLSTCKNPLDFSGISHWLNAKHMVVFIPPLQLASPMAV